MKEQYKNFITKTVWCAIIIFVLLYILSWKFGAQIFSLYDTFGYAGEAIGLTTILMAIYEKWLWKYNKFEDTPVLNKVYEGFILSNYDGIKRDAILEIKQTLLSVHITLISGESRSRSISSSIDTILGEKQLTYCYLNIPKSEFRNRSEIHYGTAMLNITSQGNLTGHYYTDRNTRGDMEFTAK